MGLFKRNIFVIAAILFGISQACVEPDTDSDLEMNSVALRRPNGVIPIKQAKLLDRTFKETRQPALAEKLGVEDNRSCWWSIDDLEDYIAYARAEALAQGYELSGLRIYTGAYPKSHSDKKMAGFATMFIVPTGNSTIQQAGFMLFPFSQEEKTDLEIDPLNMGHSRTPPSTGY
ncbi:hypothetical protein [Leeuwenhoekiella sp. H156]|uniref:hypothetical protein n=1 Tax=Leeuwenhoekiella sp. H156 TaxID=3450128 RepID=UPI003FA4A497